MGVRMDMAEPRLAGPGSRHGSGVGQRGAGPPGRREDKDKSSGAAFHESRRGRLKGKVTGRAFDRGWRRQRHARVGRRDGGAGAVVVFDRHQEAGVRCLPNRPQQCQRDCQAGSLTSVQVGPRTGTL